MWYYIDPHSGVPIYVQLKDQVKKAVASGILIPGEQLPSVRDLALKLTVNPNTVAKVYQELERDGIIKVARGLGTFVAERSQYDQGQEETLDRALEALFVEAYQLGVTEDVLRERFAKKLLVWQERLKGETDDGLGN